MNILFNFMNEKVLIEISGNNVFFSHQNFGAVKSEIDNLKLDYKGVCREFPDLETRDDWREEAIKRFKKKIKSLNTDDEKADYIIKDLKKFGYIPLFKQKKGFRPEKIR